MKITKSYKAKVARKILTVIPAITMKQSLPFDIKRFPPISLCGKLTEHQVKCWIHSESFLETNVVVTASRSTVFYVCAWSYFKSVASFYGNRRFNDGSSVLSAHEAFAVKCDKWTLRRLIWIWNLSISFMAAHSLSWYVPALYRYYLYKTFGRKLPCSELYPHPVHCILYCAENILGEIS